MGGTSQMSKVHSYLPNNITHTNGGKRKVEHLNSGIVQSSRFLKLGISHGTSTKSLGNMSLARDYDGKTSLNLKNVFRLIGVCEETDVVLFLNLTHSANIALVRKIPERKGKIVLSQESPEVVDIVKAEGIDPPRDYIPHPEKGIDACISNSTGLFLAVLPADCAPVFFYDPTNQYYAIAHAGVLGAFSGIVPRVIQCMQEWAGSKPENIECYIGPCISSSVYRLKSSGLWEKILQDRISCEEAEAFDLKEHLRAQLLRVGIAEANIELSNFCTGSDTGLFFSNYGTKAIEEKNKQGRIISLFGRK